MTASVLSDLRLRVGDALSDPAPYPDDATVLTDAVDALTPPAYLLVWNADEWGTPATFCGYTVRLDVVCIAGRIDPAPGIETLEAMVATATARLRAAALPVPIWAAPARYEVGGIPYLAARLTLAVKLDVEAPLDALAHRSD